MTRTNKNQREASLRQIPTLFENREGTRIPTDTDGGTDVFVSSATQPPEPAVVVDVSFGGIALCMPRDLSLAAGDEVQIAQNEKSLGAVVKYTLEEEDGTYRIGCFWRDLASPYTRALVKSFLEQSCGLV